MKRICAIILLVFMSLALAACGSKTYQITTKTGQTYTAKGSPEYDVKTETYNFKNEEGKKVILNQEDIEAIKEK